VFLVATLRITNATRNSVLATRAVLNSLVVAQYLRKEFAVFLPTCNMFGLNYGAPRADVLFIDMLKNRIQRAVSDVEGPCRLTCSIPAEICAVLALPAGTIELTGSQVGDVIVILSSSHASQEELREIGLLGRPHPA
jgi:hypothetical protein